MASRREEEKEGVLLRWGYLCSPKLLSIEFMSLEQENMMADGKKLHNLSDDICLGEKGRRKPNATAWILGEKSSRGNCVRGGEGII